MENRLVTLVSGHQMFEHIYQEKLSFFAQQMEAFGAKVLEKAKPVVLLDYSYIVENIQAIPKDLYTVFARAGLKAEVVNLSEKIKLIRLKA